MQSAVTCVSPTSHRPGPLGLMIHCLFKKKKGRKDGREGGRKRNSHSVPCAREPLSRRSSQGRPPYHLWFYARDQQRQLGFKSRET